MRVDPRVLFGDGTGHEVEGCRRLQDLTVVDVANRLGVAPLDQPDLHQVTQRSGRVSRTDARYPRGAIAPLAQSAEHFHGKEGVSGSSPEGGSVGVCSR